MSISQENIDLVASSAATPEAIQALNVTEMYSVPMDVVKKFQLDALRQRFTKLSGSVAMLRRLAAEQGVTEIDTLEDGAPLLFAHSLYKSYPMSAIERSQFDRLTRWFANLTSVDLSGVDAKSCETIDDWIDAIERATDIRIVHSGGTTGKLSFLPRTHREFARTVNGFTRYYEGFGNEPNAPLTGIENCPVFLPNYRKGAMGQARIIDALVDYLYDGNEDMVVTLNPSRFSADMLSLSGRMRIAEQRGELGRLQISPKLIERRDAFLKEQAEGPEKRVRAFLDRAVQHRGKRVIVMGHWHQHYEVAVEAAKLGIENLFAPDSLMTVPGGLKGRVLPDDYQEVVQRYLGFKRIGTGYGMSEATCTTPGCPEGHYHLQPFMIPYLVDPKTGVPFPRTGKHTGRYGFIDLLAETYWGGFLTGDEVTLNWGDIEPCACGRNGPFIMGDIRRYSEKEGGDDKITCAGAPEAHDRALAFLTDFA